MGVFADALNDLHTDADLSVAGTYTASAGATPISVRMIVDRVDETQNLFPTGVRNPFLCADLRQSEVGARPTDAARVTVNEGPFTGTYAVLKAESDTEGLTWRVDLNP